MRGPTIKPGIDPEFNQWSDWNLFGDDDFKASRPTSTAVTRSKPSSAKSSPTPFDAPTANWDEEPSTTEATTTTTSKPDSLHHNKVPESRKNGWETSKTSSSSGHHTSRLRCSQTFNNPTIITVQGSGHPSHSMPGQDVFVPVASGAIPKNIKSRDDHPVPKHGVVSTIR